MDLTPGFQVEADPDDAAGDALLLGLSNVGFAGLTAADHVVERQDVDQIGHVATRNLPDVAPFADGVPRRPIRLFADADLGLTVLTSDVFLPAWAADEVAEALLRWMGAADLDELAILHGVPFQHGPDQHAVFSVATDGYRRRRLAEGTVDPLSEGFLDGVVGELTTRCLDAEAPDVGVLVTPIDPPEPDLEAAVRFLDVLEALYGIDAEAGALERRAEQRRQYYEAMADRMQTLRERDSSLAGQDYPEDRMYM